MNTNLPPLTTALIAFCVGLSLLSGFGNDLEVLRPFFLTNFRNAGLAEVTSGQIWRLLTPIFVHFGILHITFNMLWLWDLGGALERRLGIAELAVMIAVMGVLSNLAEYLYHPSALFGGMSGVVYGLLGYIWMQGRYNPRFGMALHRPIIVMMLIWFVVCWLGLIGNIANMAHTAGLVMGVVWGYVAAKLRHP